MADRNAGAIGQRRVWADFCRVASIFGVVMVHTCSSLIQPWGIYTKEAWLAAFNVLSAGAICSVPIFVMLSGALIFQPDKQEVTLRQTGRRLLKVVIPLLIWNIFFLAYISYYENKPIDFFSMFSKAPMYHLWFAYMILGVYLILPILQAIYNLIHNRRELQIYFFVLWLVVTVLPIHHTYPIFELLQLQNLLGFGGYFLMGAVIAMPGKRPMPSAIWVALFVVGVASTALVTLDQYQATGKVMDKNYSYFSANVLITSIAAFAVFTQIKPSARYAPILAKLADLSFLVFFVHIVIVDKIARSPWAFDIAATIPGIVLALFVAISSYAISLAMAAGLRLLPGSRTLLG